MYQSFVYGVPVGKYQGRQENIQDNTCTRMSIVVYDLDVHQQCVLRIPRGECGGCEGFALIGSSARAGTDSAGTMGFYDWFVQHDNLDQQDSEIYQY